MFWVNIYTVAIVFHTVPSKNFNKAGATVISQKIVPIAGLAGKISLLGTIRYPPAVTVEVDEPKTIWPSTLDVAPAPIAPGLNAPVPADIQQYMDIGAGRATALPDLAPAQDLGLMDRAAKATGLSKDTLARLGITGVQALLGGRQAAQAREAGQAGRREIQAVAAPYQAQGQQLQAAAQRGELTPTGQQAIAAARAQAAQGAERRGGVGAQQMEAQVQALRTQLLQQQ